MFLPITEIVWGGTAVIVFICGIRISQAYRRTQDEMLGDYAKFFFLMGFGFVGLTLADPIITDEFYMKLSIVIGLFVLFSGIAYLAKLATRLIYPKFTKSAFWLVMLGNFITILINVKYYLLSSTRSPFLDPKTGAFMVNVPVIVGLFIVIMALIAGVVPGILFIKKARQSQEPEIKTKGLLVGWGVALFGIGGVMCGLANFISPRVSPGVVTVSNLLIALAAFSLFCGVFYVVEKRVPTTISVKAISAVAPAIKW